MATSSSACSRRASWSARKAAAASKAATGSGKSMASSFDGRAGSGSAMEAGWPPPGPRGGFLSSSRGKAPPGVK